MDVWGVYVGDSTMSYGGSIRNTYYRDYEQFPYGTLEHSGSSPNAKDPYSKVQDKVRQVKNEKELKKCCPFCKENKKRPLIKYLRKRESRKHHESICEDDEELVEEAEEEEAEDVEDVEECTEESSKTVEQLKEQHKAHCHSS